MEVCSDEMTHTPGGGPAQVRVGRGPAGTVWRAPACPTPPPAGSFSSPYSPTRPHLIPRREGGQLLDLGGLVVAAPPAQQHLAAHPLLRLRRGAGAGSAAHHVVQVLQVLRRDRLIVVTILGGWGAGQNQRGAHPKGGLREARGPDGDTPVEQLRVSPFSLSMQQSAACLPQNLLGTAPPQARCRVQPQGAQRSPDWTHSW